MRVPSIYYAAPDVGEFSSLSGHVTIGPDVFMRTVGRVRQTQGRTGRRRVWEVLSWEGTFRGPRGMWYISWNPEVSW